MGKNKKTKKEKEIDFAYIVEHCDQSNHDIPYSFDKIEWKIGETYKIRIGNIYDPSKFWIVHYEQELTVFHKFINEFYNKRGKEYRMPKKGIKRNRYCVVCTDGNYYRGLIVNIPKFTHVEVKVVVFLFDFGFTVTVSLEDDIFYLYEKMYNVPRFAIRACLPGMEPIDSDTWTSKTVEKFSELTMGKVLLCVLETRNVEMRIVFIRIGEMTPYNEIKEVGNTLLEEKLAKVSSKERNPTESKGKLISTVKYPFLFPSHEALESGLMPSTNSIAEMIKHSPVPASILYSPYLKYQNP